MAGHECSAWCQGNAGCSGSCQAAAAAQAQAAAPPAAPKAPAFLPSCNATSESQAKAAAVGSAGRPFSSLSLEDIRASSAHFARERDWEQFHTPRNLAMALVGEVGELCECFQWKGEVAPGLPGFTAREKEHVGACC